MRSDAMAKDLQYKGQKIIVFGPDVVCYYLFENLDPNNGIIEYEVKSVEAAKAAIDKALANNG